MNAILLVVCCAAAEVTATAATMFQDWHTAGSTSNLLELAVATNSMRGEGWWRHEDYSNRCARFWVVPGPNVKLRRPVSVVGETIRDSGTNWVRVYHDSEANANGYESIYYFPPGEYGGGDYHRLFGSGLFRFCTTNMSALARNFDPEIAREPFAVAQLAAVSGTLNLGAHTSGELGESTNVWGIAIEAGKVYAIERWLDYSVGRFSIWVYDQADGYRLVGSLENMGMSRGGAYWWSIWNADYLNSPGGLQSGFIEFTAIQLTYGDDVEPPTSAVMAGSSMTVRGGVVFY